MLDSKVKYYDRDKGNVSIGVQKEKGFSIVSVCFRNNKGDVLKAKIYAGEFLNEPKAMFMQNDFITGKIPIFYFTDDLEKVKNAYYE